MHECKILPLRNMLAFYILKVYDLSISKPEVKMLLKAFAKINWSLDITGKRSDGFHLMDMIMQPVSLADDITLTPSSELSIHTGGYPPSRADESNLAWKAASLLMQTFSIDRGVRIDLFKRIPVGAGLGGGSADAAAVLSGLNLLWNIRLPSEKLEELGLLLGADVPFCLRGGLSRTRGIGEILENHDCRANYWLLIIQPCRALSTRDIFAAFQSSESVRHPMTDEALKALSAGNTALLASSVCNVLEPVSASKCPEISNSISALQDEGAFTAHMTGSGSAVFGAFRSGSAAEKAMKKLSQRYKTIHLCHTQHDSIRIMEA